MQGDHMEVSIPATLVPLGLQRRGLALSKGCTLSLSLILIPFNVSRRPRITQRSPATNQDMIAHSKVRLTMITRFYLCFIIPAFIFAIVCAIWYPNTRGLALEEIAALFGDQTADFAAEVNEHVADGHGDEKRGDVRASSDERFERA
jgi:hypothetical protein